jgi:predicted membrane channel-forming protein YqfA (hemolysin III family)
MDPEIAVIFIIIGVLAVIVLVHLINQYKLKVKTHELLEKSIDKGVDVTPELLAKLNNEKSSRFKDLRRGIIMTAIGAAVFCFSIMIPKDDTAVVFKGLAIFPFFIGMGFLLVWKINKYDD